MLVGSPFPIMLAYVHVFLSRGRSYPVIISIKTTKLKLGGIAYHNILQPLPNPPFPLLPLLNLPPQASRLLSIPPHLALRLLAPQHRALERRIVRLPLQLLPLIRQAVKRCNLVLHYAALARMSVLACRAGVGVEAGGVRVRGSLLIDAFGRYLE